MFGFFFSCFSEHVLIKRGTLVSSQCWEAVISYVEMAWGLRLFAAKNLTTLRTIDHESRAFGFLAAQCMTAISNGKFTRNQLKQHQNKVSIARFECCFSNGFTRNS
jgi:hypothetical protein